MAGRIRGGSSPRSKRCRRAATGGSSSPIWRVRRWKSITAFTCSAATFPNGQLKNGLSADRLSSPRFLANAWKLQCHVLAYAIYVLFQEANASVSEVAGKEVATLRQQLFKAGAIVETSVRRIWIHFSGHWPRRSLFVRICEAGDRYLAGFLLEPTATGLPRDLLWLG